MKPCTGGPVIPENRTLAELFLVPAAICVQSSAAPLQPPDVHINALLERVIADEDGAHARLTALLCEGLASGDVTQLSLPLTTGVLALKVDFLELGGRPAILARCFISASAVQAIVADMFEDDPRVPSGVTVTQYRLLRRALQIAQVGFVRDDPMAGTWEASDSLWDMMGIRKQGTPADSDFASVMASLGDESFVNLARDMRLELASGTDRRGHEFKITRPDTGEQRRFSAEFHHVTEDGRATTWTIVRDVTDQAKVLRELSAREALLQSAERIGQLGHWWLDVPAQTLKISGNLHRLLDGEASTPLTLSKDALLAKFADCIDIDDLRARVSELTRSSSRWRLDHRIRRKSDGAERWLHQMGEAIFGSDGQLVVLRGAEQDITARIDARTERDRFRKALEQVQRVETIDHLTGRLAHEVSNMLQPAFSFIGLAAAALDRGEARQASALLDKTLDAMVRVDKVLKDDLAQAGSHGELLEVVSVGEFVSSLDGILTPKAGARVTVNYLPGASTCHVRMSRIGAAQIFLNIIQNAFDAAGDDSRVDVTLFLSDDPADPPETVVADITDSGPGFSAEALEQAFIPLFTTKPKGKGTGLGLPVVRSMIERWGGSVEIGNLPTGGARVRLKLPIVGREPSP